MLRVRDTVRECLTACGSITGATGHLPPIGAGPEPTRPSPRGSGRSPAEEPLPARLPAAALPQRSGMTPRLRNRRPCCPYCPGALRYGQSAQSVEAPRSRLGPAPTRTPRRRSRRQTWPASWPGIPARRCGHRWPTSGCPGCAGRGQPTRRWHRTAEFKPRPQGRPRPA